MVSAEQAAVCSRYGVEPAPALPDEKVVAHLRDHAPEVLPYLALPPGWRFLIAPGHEDVWFDEQLLNV